MMFVVMYCTYAILVPCLPTPMYHVSINFVCELYMYILSPILS